MAGPDITHTSNREVVPGREHKTPDRIILPYAESGSDKGAPRMARHYGIMDAELIECIHQQSCLSCCGPYSEPRPLTIAKARAVEAHHAIFAGKKIDQATHCEVLDQGSVTMEQHNARSRGIAPIDILEYYAVAFKELANWWIPQLGGSRGTNTRPAVPSR